MARQWKTIQDVPVKAWFRTKSQKSDIRQIKGINLQYVPMGMVAAAGEAVEIANTFWRVEELIHVFEFSFDLNTWYACEGEIPNLGDIDKLGAYVERELNRQRGLTDESVAKIQGMITAVTASSAQIERNEALLKDLREELAALEITVLNIKSGCKPEPEAKPEAKPSSAAAKGATPPK